MTTDSNRAVTDLIGGLTSLSRDAAAMDAATVNIYRALLDDAVRAAALAQVERDDAIAKVDAADQRTRSLDAALTAERETSRGLVAQVDTWRDTWARVETIVDEAFGPFPVWPVYDTICAMERGIHDGIRAAQELAAIRDLVAPGNPQGTVVDAVRTHVAAHQRPCNGDCDIALARRQVGPDGDVPGNARECAEMWEREAVRVEAERDAAIRAQAETTTALVTADREIAKLRAELAELRARPVLTVEAFTEAYIKTKHGGKAWPGEEADRRGLTAQFRATFAALGPVALPSPDRAEELLRSFDAGVESLDVSNLTDDEFEQGRLASMRAALASLGTPPTSPPAARPLFADVSEEELALEYARAVDRIPGIRAVLARLEVSLVAPVDPEVVARRYHDHKESPVPGWPYATDHDINSPIGADHEQARLHATAAMRATLTAAGIPVTPEVGK